LAPALRRVKAPIRDYIQADGRDDQPAAPREHARRTQQDGDESITMLNRSRRYAKNAQIPRVRIKAGPGGTRCSTEEAGQ